MTSFRLATLVLAAVAAAGSAHAGEAPCWLDKGVLVVPAEVAGIAGDYILDTGSPRTVLHETRAQAHGVEGAETSGPVRLAGMALPAQTVPVQDLDGRTALLPTPIAGVIGLDVLRGFVLDVDFAPCRVRLWAPGEAPAFRGGRALALGWDGELPVIAAEVSDGERRLSGPFVPATGANAAVRLAEDLASVPAADRPGELYPDGVWLARLPKAEIAGRRLRNLPAGLTAAQGGSAGLLGAPLLSRFRLRFDFPAGRLTIGR